MSDLPVDALSKIASYYLGEPKYMRLKQNRYKIHYTEPITREYRSPNNPKNILRFEILHLYHQVKIYLKIIYHYSMKKYTKML